MDSNLYELLKEIYDRYTAFLGHKSLEKLTYFINGYEHCLYKVNGTTGLSFGNFQRYIENIYKMYNFNWSTIIQFFSKDDEDAFNNFYFHLNNYIAENGCLKNNYE